MLSVSVYFVIVLGIEFPHAMTEKIVVDERFLLVSREAACRPHSFHQIIVVLL